MFYTYFFLLEYSDTSWNMPGCPFSYTVIPPCILLSSSGYEAVQGGTRQWNLVRGGRRQYQKVPYPWIWRYEAVHEGTRPRTTSYLHIQGYGTFWYCLVPPGTASYPEADRAVWEKPEFTKMLVCTSTYLYILVHTDSYQSCKSRPIHTLVLVCTSTYQYR
jgi:hypothetical protein